MTDIVYIDSVHSEEVVKCKSCNQEYDVLINNNDLIVIDKETGEEVRSVNTFATKRSTSITYHVNFFCQKCRSGKGVNSRFIHLFKQLTI